MTSYPMLTSVDAPEDTPALMSITSSLVEARALFINPARNLSAE
jgi:hypothetical protein